MLALTSNRNRFRQSATVLACSFTLFTGLAFTAKADQWNQKTNLTFSAPVEVPGTVLPAGSYVFQLLDSNSDRDIVQVYNKDMTHLYATILGVSDYRMKTPSKTIIRFEERASNAPPAVKAWFYPGNNYGVAFVYPHKRAAELAKRTGQNVLSMSDEESKNISAPVKSRDDKTVKDMEKAEVNSVKPSGENGTANDALTPPPSK